MEPDDGVRLQVRECPAALLYEQPTAFVNGMSHGGDRQ